MIFENFKNIISRKYENLNEKIIYDMVHEELKRSSKHYDLADGPNLQHSENVSNTNISIIDKLKLTRKLWYLPYCNRSTIKKLLKNKEVGVSVIWWPIIREKDYYETNYNITKTWIQVFLWMKLWSFYGSISSLFWL